MVGNKLCCSLLWREAAMCLSSSGACHTSSPVFTSFPPPPPGPAPPQQGLPWSPCPGLSSPTNFHISTTLFTPSPCLAPTEPNLLHSHSALPRPALPHPACQLSVSTPGDPLGSGKDPDSGSRYCRYCSKSTQSPGPLSKQVMSCQPCFAHLVLVEAVLRVQIMVLQHHVVARHLQAAPKAYNHCDAGPYHSTHLKAPCSSVILL